MKFQIPIIMVKNIMGFIYLFFLFLLSHIQILVSCRKFWSFLTCKLSPNGAYIVQKISSLFSVLLFMPIFMKALPSSKSLILKKRVCEYVSSQHGRTGAQQNQSNFSNCSDWLISCKCLVMKLSSVRCFTILSLYEWSILEMV